MAMRMHRGLSGSLPLRWLAWSVLALPVKAATLDFGGHTWTIRSGEGGPGPNRWAERNVWLDAQGHLHLRISEENGQWSCAEVSTTRRLGFGRYEFQIEGGIDRFDDRVVLGLFNYPTADVGPDGTHEIDLEFARWGKPDHPIGNYTVWPVEKKLGQTTKTFAFQLTGTTSTHRFDWAANQVFCRSWQGLGDTGAEIAQWTYQPTDADRRISRSPMPVHLNLWLFQGKPPKDRKEVEVVIRSFSFTAP